MGILGDISCKMGLHKWDAWEYESSSSCNQIRVCSRGCGKKEGQITHIWREWDYEAIGSCNLARICLRCNEKEKGEKKHSWGKWVYMIADTVDQEQSKERIFKKIDGLREAYNKFIQKLNYLRRSLATESDSSAKFKLLNEIEETEKEIEKYEADLKLWEPLLKGSNDSVNPVKRCLFKQANAGLMGLAPTHLRRRTWQNTGFTECLQKELKMEQARVNRIEYVIDVVKNKIAYSIRGGNGNMNP